MAVDMSKVRKQREIEQKRADDRKAMFAKRDRYIKYWKPSVGENLLRIMPPWTEEGYNANQFWREVWSHWNVGAGGFDDENGFKVDCGVKTPGEDADFCPVCELVAELYATGDAGDREIAKELRPKPSYLVNVVDLRDAVWTAKDLAEWDEKTSDEAECPFTEGDTKVQVWSCPGGVSKELLDYFMDVDMTLFEGGRDLILTREGKGRMDTKYRTRISPNPKDFEFLGDFGKISNDLDDLTYFREADHVKAILLGNEKEYFAEKKKLAASEEDPKQIEASTEVEDEVIEVDTPKLSSRALKAQQAEEEPETVEVAEEEDDEVAAIQAQLEAALKKRKTKRAQ